LGKQEYDLLICKCLLGREVEIEIGLLLLLI
jgi:hypothetical protein